MDGEQTVLLSWKPACRVHAFPPARRVNRVRQIAESLSRKHGRAADAYWKQVVTRTWNEMATLSVPEHEIHAALHALFDAVLTELNRMAYRQRGGNAA